MRSFQEITPQVLVHWTQKKPNSRNLGGIQCFNQTNLNQLQFEAVWQRIMQELIRLRRHNFSCPHHSKHNNTLNYRLVDICSDWSLEIESVNDLTRLNYIKRSYDLDTNRFKVTRIGWASQPLWNEFDKLLAFWHFFCYCGALANPMIFNFHCAQMNKLKDSWTARPGELEDLLEVSLLVYVDDGKHDPILNLLIYQIRIFQWSHYMSGI